ncbi:ribonuclease P protein component [Labilibacter sediminis]|nr:ribonuclease P protein component [Labilibacter sediminis]
MTHSQYTFPKAERLCSHNIIEELFTKGDGFVCYPFRVVYLKTSLTEEVNSQVMFSVSKRKFKKAVDRNLLKRRCKEAYRLNRKDFSDFLISSNQQIAFAMVYISSQRMPYSSIEKGMKKALLKLQEKLSVNNNNQHETNPE